jgi:hypothetical protein
MAFFPAFNLIDYLESVNMFFWPGLISFWISTFSL